LLPTDTAVSVIITCKFTKLVDIFEETFIHHCLLLLYVVIAI